MLPENYGSNVLNEFETIESVSSNDFKTEIFNNVLEMFIKERFNQSFRIVKRVWG